MRTTEGTTARIFLSYRRDDSIEQTNRLDEALAREFPDLGVFIDRRAISAGADFEQEIVRQLSAGPLVLVLIGPDWLGERADGSTRLDDPRDLVRREVELALAHSAHGGQLLPVLVAGATMPPAERLPASLHALGRLNAMPLRSGDDQAADLARILARVRARVDDPADPPARRFLPHTFDGEDDRLQALDAPFQGTAQTLQALLAVCSSQADALRHQAESLLRTAAQWTAEHPALALLRHDPDTGLSHLDEAMASPLGRLGAVGNLTGTGRLAERRGRRRQELDMALRLGDAFRATVAALHPVATVGWVYYTSRSGFIHIHPWTHSRVGGYHPRLLTMDFFRAGTPTANPQRRVFWTLPYEDHYGKGMMVTVAAPVWQGRAFLGTVAIDLGIDLLNDFVSAHRLAGGPVLLVSADGELIAAPGIARSRDSGRRPLAEALPPGLAAARVLALLRQPGRWVIGAHLVLIARIEGTDWSLVHACRRDGLR